MHGLGDVPAHLERLGEHHVGAVDAPPLERHGDVNAGGRALDDRRRRVHRAAIHDAPHDVAGALGPGRGGDVELVVAVVHRRPLRAGVGSRRARGTATVGGPVLDGSGACALRRDQGVGNGVAPRRHRRHGAVHDDHPRRVELGPFSRDDLTGLGAGLEVGGAGGDVLGSPVPAVPDPRAHDVDSIVLGGPREQGLGPLLPLDLHRPLLVLVLGHRGGGVRRAQQPLIGGVGGEEGVHVVGVMHAAQIGLGRSGVARRADCVLRRRIPIDVDPLRTGARQQPSRVALAPVLGRLVDGVGLGGAARRRTDSDEPDGDHQCADPPEPDHEASLAQHD